MNLKSWLYLFWTSLVIGGLAGLAAGLGLQWTDKEFTSIGAAEAGYNAANYFMAGLMFSIISQMGFFAYLTVNYIANGMFRNRYMWLAVQVIAIVLVLFDLAFLRVLAFEDRGWGTFIILPLVLLGVSLSVAYVKAKLTKPAAFIPTLFFMSVGTTLELIPALHMENSASTVFMAIPLVVCNAWQILSLHKLVKASPSPAAK